MVSAFFVIHYYFFLCGWREAWEALSWGVELGLKTRGWVLVG
jgi:hypothetical protein